MMLYKNNSEASLENNITYGFVKNITTDDIIATSSALAVNSAFFLNNLSTNDKCATFIL